MIRCLTAALVAAFFLGAPHTTHALSCAPPAHPAEAVHEVDVLFTGTVLSADRDHNTYTFAVVRSYIGDPGDRIRVSTGRSPWAWDYEVGQDTAVAARIYKDGFLRAGPCPLVRGGPQKLIDWLSDNPNPRRGVGASQPHP